MGGLAQRNPPICRQIRADYAPADPPYEFRGNSLLRCASFTITCRA